jgi:hypothetical protein
MTSLPDESGPVESIRHELARNAVGEGQSAMEHGHLVHGVSIEASAVSIPLLKMGGSLRPSHMW